MLVVKNLHASVNGKEILRGIDLEVRAGEVHAIMGPNGSGKSTLAQLLAGRDGYEVTEGTVSYLERDLLAMSSEDRARAGVFLAFQYPVEIPGVSIALFLKSALNAIRRQRGLPELDSTRQPSASASSVRAAASKRRTPSGKMLAKLMLR